MKGQIRQGDVLLVPVDVAPPTNVRPVTEVILALGELTGHAHRLRAATLYEWETDGQRYVRVGGAAPGTIQHEEHDPIPAPVVVAEQTYRVVPQKEMDLSNEWQRVTD